MDTFDPVTSQGVAITNLFWLELDISALLLGTGRRLAGDRAEVALATLASTFITSIAGVVTFLILSVENSAPVAPDWGIGLALGLDGPRSAARRRAATTAPP